MRLFSKKGWKTFGFVSGVGALCGLLFVALYYVFLIYRGFFLEVFDMAVDYRVGHILRTSVYNDCMLREASNADVEEWRAVAICKAEISHVE